MQRYFIRQEAIDGQQIHISKDDFFHMTKVMRMTSGEKVICVDENQQVYQCVLRQADQPILEIENILEEQHELDVHVRLIYGLPKADKFEYVLQKCTELGVHEVVPFLARRCVVKTDASRFQKKRERYEKIIKEACEQSQREALVQLQDPLNLKEVLNLSGDLSIVAYEENSKQNEHTKLHQVLCQMKPGMTINIVVGPEGGLDAEEVAALEAHGYISCSLGPRILRSETAPLYLMSVIAYHRELMKEDL